jgi:hypothetical protein
MWETKTSGTGGRRDVANTYTWSATSPNPDGTLFTDFLAKMNCSVSEDGSCPVDGKYRDWRIPTLAELRTIVDLSAPGCGSGSPCIDPTFGPTAASVYWSSSSDANFPASAWDVYFSNGVVVATDKTFSLYVRAVRGGS